ncbi:MAG TPA: hypothetical protein VFL95_06830 [Gemmatimonadales bacterium]|nr:hypothetical protein [Gemmatimonadales bacterium]
MKHLPRWFRLAAAVLAAALLWPSPAMAQCSSGDSCTLTIAMPVAQVLRLSLSTDITDLGTPTAADFTAGYRDATGPGVTVKANRAWQLTVDGMGTQFTYTGSLADPAKPLSDLAWGTTAGSYTNTLGTPAAFGSGGPGLTVGPIYFRTHWDFLRDIPGDYQAVVNFTLAAP